MIPLNSADSQETLQTRLRRGDRQALSDAFSCHRERLLRMIRFRMDPRLAGRVDPDDVLQEAWLDAASRLDYLQAGSESSVFIWLRMICRQTLVNVFRRHLDSEKRDAGREVRCWGSASGQSTSISIARQFAVTLTSASQVAMRTEATGQLSRALETMESLDQEVIALRHFEDLSNAEVARALDISVTAASNRYVRALARLRKLLESLPDFAGVAEDGFDG